MQEEEYSAYLKGRSYEDLVSISYGINKETQAARYAMVLEEIAKREVRDEKMDNKPLQAAQKKVQKRPDEGLGMRFP